jgi:1-acyl-sn-glycerol-3-phosphate acyltransferase
MSISRFLLKIAGWKVQGKIPIELNKYVVIVAPHTSNWDFFIGYLVYKVLGIKAHFLIKREAFVFPFKKIITAIGGIPVDRHIKNNVVEQVIEMFNQHKEFVVTITPEGTRSLVKQWKNGFYRITRGANVPLVAGFLDYQNKTAGIIGIIALSDDYESDLLKIQNLYRTIKPKHPDKFWLPCIELEK